MEKIVTREERDKKLKRNHLIMGLILIFLMVFSTIGFAFSFGTKGISNNIDEVEYKGIKFVRDNTNSGYWSFDSIGNNFITRYNPEETEEISFLNSKTINNYANEPLYFVGNTSEGFSELDRNLRDRFVSRIGSACLSEECNGDYPIKDCSQDNIIIIREPVDENELIYLEENCVYIIADSFNQAKYADAYLFSLLGIK